MENADLKYIKSCFIKGFMDNNNDMIKQLCETTNIDIEAINLLHYACLFGNLPFVQLFVEKYNANVEKYCDEGFTPLYYSCKEGELPIVEYLIKKCNANVEAPCANGVTPLCGA